jgi:metal-responsive CopG/Arc/MetJ family transcriptional regulator
MKTAISIPDDLFDSAERYAEQQGLSRSELYAKALRRFLEDRNGESITERLNAVYDKESNSLDPVLARLQALSLSSDAWE